MAFANGVPQMSLGEVTQKINEVITKDVYEPPVQQEMALLNNPMDMIRALYSVGFIGIRDHITGSFIFCHDGHNPTREFTREDQILIHPCYWMALNLTRCPLKSVSAPFGVAAFL
ncbi:MAG: hypothetical protein ABSA97_06465 [Verrucomicrobiia bacterium]